MNTLLTTYLLLLLASVFPSNLYGLKRTDPEPQTLLIPFEILEDKMVVKARVNQRLGYFIIDTGYPCLALNNQIFKGKQSQSSRHGIRSKSSPLSTTLVDLELGQLEVKKAYAEIIDLRRIVATRKVEFLGLIGVQLLQNYCVIFDFEKQHLILYAQKRKKATKHWSDWPEARVFPLYQKGHLLCLNLNIAEHSFRLALDTGAGANLFEKHEVNRILNSIDFLDKRRLGGIGPTDIVVDRVMLSAAAIGDIHYPSMATLLCDLQNINNILTGKSIDGILGFPFFQVYRLGINFKTRELLVWPEKKAPKAIPSPLSILKDQLDHK